MNRKTFGKPNPQKSQTLTNILVISTTLSSIGLAIWGWILQHPDLLPAPNSKPGKALRSQYQGTAHDIWLILLTLTIGFLIFHIYKSKQKEVPSNQEKYKSLPQSTIIFIKKNPIVFIFFIAYTVAMISGTTYLYKDMVGWYPELIKGHFLDNFSLRGAFVSETMRRTDYRFFPLAHQDLHILSWFSIHIKTWMLFNAAELSFIALLIVKFLRGLHPKESVGQSTILLITSLLLIHPSTGTTFFHVIYCERLLCLVFMLYITSYLDYRKHKKLSTFYLTFLWALLGIYIKDIAILLFVIPPACLWILDAKKITSNMQNERNNLSDKCPNQLEKWLCSLTIIFITSYIFLALIPSSYAAEGAYNEEISLPLILDLRFYIFSLIALARAIAVLSRRIQFNLLDAINISAVAYSGALAFTYVFDATSYLSLPFQLIATINIGWAWIFLVDNKKYSHFTKSRKLISAVFTSFLVISFDHLATKSTFINTISRIKADQSYVQETYEKLHEISREIRETGDDVNIIINQSSRLSAERHLNRIPYRSLIEYGTKTNSEFYGLFMVRDGSGKGKIYTPQAGDLIVNLDKTINLLEPLLKNVKTKLIYRHNQSERTGIILRISKATN